MTSTFYEEPKPARSLYSSRAAAPLHKAAGAGVEKAPGIKSRVFAFFRRAAQRWHDAQLRAARLRVMEMLDSRELKDMTYLHGDVSEVREILATRYRDRLLS